MTPVYRFSQAGSIATGQTSYRHMGVGVSSVAVPFAPTIGEATATDTASVTFTPSAIGATATSYTATSSPGGITGTAASSPITVSGLTVGTAYTFTVTASNANGTSTASGSSNSVTPISVNSYDSIATATVGAGGTSTITFSSIPSTYTHLQLRAAHKSSSPVWATVTLNSDSTTSNYVSHRFEATDNSVIAESFTSTGQNKIFTSYPFTGSSVVDFLDYKNSNKYKTVRGLNGWVGDGVGGNNGEVNYMSLLWMNTSAINSISITISGQTFQQYSSFALYGIKG